MNSLHPIDPLDHADSVEDAAARLCTLDPSDSGAAGGTSSEVVACEDVRLGCVCVCVFLSLSLSLSMFVSFIPLDLLCGHRLCNLTIDMSHSLFTEHQATYTHTHTHTHYTVGPVVSCRLRADAEGSATAVLCRQLPDRTGMERL